MLLNIRWLLLSLGIGPAFGPIATVCAQQTTYTPITPSLAPTAPVLSPVALPAPETTAPQSTALPSSTNPVGIAPPPLMAPVPPAAGGPPPTEPEALDDESAAASSSPGPTPSEDVDEEYPDPDLPDADEGTENAVDPAGPDADVHASTTETADPKNSPRPLQRAFDYLAAAPTQRFAIAMIRTRPRPPRKGHRPQPHHHHISLLWYGVNERGLPVPRTFDGTRYGIQLDATRTLDRVTSVFIPIEPSDHLALRAAMQAKSRRPNPRGTCLSSVIGTSRESLLKIAKRFFGAHLGDGPTDDPGSVFTRSGMPTTSAWHFELFALKRPDLLQAMGLEMLATGPLLPPTLRYAPELSKLRNRTGHALLEDRAALN